MDGKLLGVLNYNLMIPVEIDQLQEIDLVIHKRDRSQIKNYKELCKKELEWCREHSEIICNKVNVIREKYLAKERWSGRDRCLDFLKLEEECVRFNKRSKKDHFPDIVHSIGEVSRVLKNGGMLFISDPCPNECDTDRFVDDYMRLKKDGHIKFYTKDEWTDICCNQGLIILDSFESSIRFPKKKDTAFGYEAVLMKHDKTVIDSYDLAETDTELYITERVNNILFMKE